MKFYGVFEYSYPDGETLIGYYQSKELAQTVLNQQKVGKSRSLFHYELIEFETVD